MCMNNKNCLTFFIGFTCRAFRNESKRVFILSIRHSLPFQPYQHSIESFEDIHTKPKSKIVFKFEF